MVTFTAVTRECCHPIGELIVVGHKASGIPVSAKAFAGIKGEGRNFPKVSHKLSVIPGQVCLRTIFYHPQIMFLCDRHDCVHIRWLSKQMYWNDPDRGRCDLCFNVDWINRKGFLLCVAK